MTQKADSHPCDFFSKHNELLARMDENLKGVKKDTANIVQRLDKGDERFIKHGERITRVETKLNGHKSSNGNSVNYRLLLIISGLITVLGGAIALAVKLI